MPPLRNGVEAPVGLAAINGVDVHALPHTEVLELCRVLGETLDATIDVVTLAPGSHVVGAAPGKSGGAAVRVALDFGVAEAVEPGRARAPPLLLRLIDVPAVLVRGLGLAPLAGAPRDVAALGAATAANNM